MGKKKRDAAGLAIVRTVDVPLEEVSGLCLRRGPGGVLQVVAIGDRAAIGAWATVPDDPDGPVRWETASLTGLAGTRLPADDPQIEAVCADGAGRVLVASIDLDIPDDHPLGPAWRDPDGSRGEGAVFLANGHLLIIKEKDPSAFIEFGPEGEAASGFRAGALEGGTALRPGEAWPVQPGEQTFVLLAAWTPDRELARACRDLSDLEVGPDGRLYVLSDKSASIARLADLDPGNPFARAHETWELPRSTGSPRVWPSRLAAGRSSPSTRGRPGATWWSSTP